MRRRPPRAPRTDPPLPYPTLFRSRKVLAFAIARFGEGVDLPALPDGDLRDDMRRGTKTIKPETSPIAGGTQRTPADQARAKQWCRLFIRIDVGDMKAEMSVGNGMGRIASVSRTSCKAERVAQI